MVSSRSHSPTRGPPSAHDRPAGACCVRAPLHAPTIPAATLSPPPPGAGLARFCGLWSICGRLSCGLLPLSPPLWVCCFFSCFPYCCGFTAGFVFPSLLPPPVPVADASPEVGAAPPFVSPLCLYFPPGCLSASCFAHRSSTRCSCLPLSPCTLPAASPSPTPCVPPFSWGWVLSTRRCLPTFCFYPTLRLICGIHLPPRFPSLLFALAFINAFLGFYALPWPPSLYPALSSPSPTPCPFPCLPLCRGPFSPTGSLLYGAFSFVMSALSHPAGTCFCRLPFPPLVSLNLF